MSFESYIKNSFRNEGIDKHYCRHNLNFKNLHQTKTLHLIFHILSNSYISCEPNKHKKKKKNHFFLFLRILYLQPFSTIQETPKTLDRSNPPPFVILGRGNWNSRSPLLKFEKILNFFVENCSDWFKLQVLGFYCGFETEISVICCWNLNKKWFFFHWGYSDFLNWSF